MDDGAHGAHRVRKIISGLLQSVSGCALIIIGPALFMVAGCVVVSGLPSLAHQPTATHFHDVMSLSPRWQLHRIDRLIARAAQDDCARTWVRDQNQTFLTEHGHSIYQKAAGAWGTTFGSSDCSGLTTRRSNWVCRVTTGTGVILSKSEGRKAKGLRAAYRAGELDLYQLANWVEGYCPIDLGIGGKW